MAKLKPVPLPYENASSGRDALRQMQKLVQTFGASSFGCLEDFEKGEVLVQFRWRERNVTIKANSKGYAAAYLRRHPYNSRRRDTERAYQQKALQIGQVAVYSMLRDWIKGQVAAVESGMFSFESAFLGQIMLDNGQTVLERLEQTEWLRLPGPES